MMATRRRCCCCRHIANNGVSVPIPSRPGFFSRQHPQTLALVQVSPSTGIRFLLSFLF
ncbi:AGAP012327-PA [Anopheles gambiae str. PEST]|uniref:AGAP012327-PA n=1 Tax=Anopheles gambiae TaxID=7165 RepID=A0NGV2_ANOGA|nr:AGAP012327-PA [Anopheles gambiae str. PEST]